MTGSELVVNGGFTALGAPWDFTGGGSLALGRVEFDSNAQSIFQSITGLITGRSYYISYDIYSYAASDETMTVSLGGTSGTDRSDWETYTETIIGGSDGTIQFDSSGTFAAGEQIVIDDVSVKEISVASEIEASVYDILILDSTVSGLVSRRVYPEIIPQNTSYPAIAYSIIAAPRGHHFTGMTDLVPARFQITAFADTYAEMRVLSDAIRGAMDSLQETVGTVEIASSLMIDEVDLTERVPGVDKITKHARALDFRITYREA